MLFTMDADFKPLEQYGLIYVASPYTKYALGIHEAAKDVSRVTGRLIRRGLKAFSPIVHSHYVSLATGIDPLDHVFWMKADEAFMQKCDALIICMLSGWEESYGVNLEIKNFTAAKKDIHHLDPGFIR